MSKPNSEVLIQPQYYIASGIDIHKDIIITHVESKDGLVCETKEWTTMTPDLYKISDYLKSKGTESILMESTGVYWISLFHILNDSDLKVIVSNPQHIKQIPKRKTDKKDAKWLCTLMLNGLVRKSFIPDEDLFEFREYCRNKEKYRKLITQSTNRIVRILERCNYKLRSVSSSIRTKSCQDIITAIIAGESDSEVLAQMCKGRMRNKIALMRLAVQGKLTEADRENLQMLKEDIKHYENQLSRIDKKLEEKEQNLYKSEIDLLEKVSGVGPSTSKRILAEIGTDMSKFETSDHLTSWAGLAPGNNESAGKRKSTSTKRGNKHLRSALITVAWAAVRTKHSYWSYQFAYFKSKMPPKKAIVVIARKMLKLMYRVIKEGIIYKEAGRKQFEKVQSNKKIAILRRLEQKMA